MTFSVRAYVVDIGKMTGAIGGGNAALPGAIAESCADMIEDFDYLLGKDGAAASGGLAAMIAILISGDFRRLEDADGLGTAGLGYALECLAAHLSGGPLDTHAIKDVSGDWLRDQPVLRDLAGRPAALVGRMPLPEDLPAICVIGRGEVPGLLQAALRERDHNPDPTSRACYDELIIWLEIAAAEGNGLVAFCY